MRFAIVLCDECDSATPEEAWKHVGCDTNGFGGHLKRCQCCGNVYYAQSNQMYYNSPCCESCHDSYDKGWMKELELRKYNKAMGYA